MKKIWKFALLFLIISLPTHATLLKVSIFGDVNFAGAKFNGVEAPIGSPFSLDFLIDDTLKQTYNSGQSAWYDVLGLSYTTVLGTYNISIQDDFQLVASRNEWYADFSYVDQTLHSYFYLSLMHDTGVINASTPSNWQYNTVYGDVLYRDTDYENGIRRNESINHLAGYDPYSVNGDTLSMKVTEVPEPSTSVLVCIVLIAGSIRRWLK